MDEKLAQGKSILPTDSSARKETPLYSGFMAYFPAAMAEVSRLSKNGSERHNPGQPICHSRHKSNDHADCLLRHLLEAGTRDDDGFSHTVKVAWRAMALLQEELEAAGAPAAPAAVFGDTTETSWAGVAVPLGSEHSHF